MLHGASQYSYRELIRKFKNGHIVGRNEFPVNIPETYNQMNMFETTLQARQVSTDGGGTDFINVDKKL